MSNVVSVCPLIQADPRILVLLACIGIVANVQDLVFFLFGGDYCEFCVSLLAFVLRTFPCFLHRSHVIAGIALRRLDDGDDWGYGDDWGNRLYLRSPDHGLAILVGRHEVHVEDRLLGCLQKPLDVARPDSFASAPATQDAIEMHRVEAPMVVLVKGRVAIPAGGARFA